MTESEVGLKAQQPLEHPPGGGGGAAVANAPMARSRSDHRPHPAGRLPRRTGGVDKWAYDDTSTEQRKEAGWQHCEQHKPALQERIGRLAIARGRPSTV